MGISKVNLADIRQQTFVGEGGLQYAHKQSLINILDYSWDKRHNHESR